MPKKIFAVTNVKSGNSPEQFTAAGEELNPTAMGLSKEQLLELHAAGAIEVKVVGEEVMPEDEEVVTPEGEVTPEGDDPDAEEGN